jgi:hypothetical protein
LAYFSGLNFRGYPPKIWPNIWYVYVPPSVGSWRSPIDKRWCPRFKQQNAGLTGWKCDSNHQRLEKWWMVDLRIFLRQRHQELFMISKDLSKDLTLVGEF